MEAAVEKGAGQPPNHRGRGQQQRDLHQLFSFSDRPNSSRDLPALLGLRDGTVERHLISFQGYRANR
jgi:hypothetical protein